jgi:hypothetical protein
VVYPFTWRLLDAGQAFGTLKTLPATDAPPALCAALPTQPQQLPDRASSVA